MSTDWNKDLRNRYGNAIPLHVTVPHAYDQAGEIVTPIACSAAGLIQTESTIISAALPTGASTADLQTAANVSLVNIELLQIANNGKLTDVSTATLQTEANATLVNIEAGLGGTMEKCGLALDSGIISGTTYKILIDLSNTASFPHNNTGSVSIDHLSQNIVFSTGSAVAEISIGIISRIDAFDSDIKWLKTFQYRANNSYSNIGDIINFQPSTLAFNNNTIKAITNNISTNVLSVSTMSTLDSPTGGLLSPALGDVIIRYTYFEDSYQSHLTALYHSDA